MVPLHLQGENNGFSILFSSDRQILQRGKPLLVEDAPLITIIGAFDSSLPLGIITLLGILK